MPTQTREQRAEHWQTLLETSSTADTLGDRQHTVAQELAAGRTLQAVADAWGVSRERIRQIAARAEVVLKKGLEP